MLITSLPGVLIFNLGSHGNTEISLTSFCMQAIVFFCSGSGLKKINDVSLASSRKFEL